MVWNEVKIIVKKAQYKGFSLTLECQYGVYYVITNCLVSTIINHSFNFYDMKHLFNLYKLKFKKDGKIEIKGGK